ncbi:hypothetical protein [Flavobacterium sp. GCM10023249]|uniref:hypothetical protein n=1 Tax=unclassified Flavobacterium TaxID=196869 RepID=UPI00361B89BD
MKNCIRTFIITAFLFLIVPDNLFAQGPPPWAPAHGYRAKTRYVYFPDENMYYDLRSRNYIYLSGRNWVVRTAVPRIFVGINLGKSAQIELDFVGERPYVQNQIHVVKYKKYKKAKPQKVKVIEVHHYDHDDHHDHHHKHGKGHGKHGKH